VNTEPPSQENFRDEYKLVFEGYKFFVSIRFITVAFGISIQSALLPIYNQAVKESRLNGYAIFSVAMLFLLALLIVERRTTSLFRSLLKRGTELEFQLGLPTDCRTFSTERISFLYHAYIWYQPRVFRSVHLVGYVARCNNNQAIRTIIQKGKN